MFSVLHCAFFGTLISLVDVATHRIYRATLFLALISILPSVNPAAILAASILLVLMKPLYGIFRGNLGFGDLLLLPLASIYTQVLPNRQIPLIALFLSLSLYSLMKSTKDGPDIRTRVAASPYIFLIAVIVGESL